MISLESSSAMGELAFGFTFLAPQTIKTILKGLDPFYAHTHTQHNSSPFVHLLPFIMAMTTKAAFVGAFEVSR